MDQPECLLKHITQQNENPATRNSIIIGFKTLNSVNITHNQDSIPV